MKLQAGIGRFPRSIGRQKFCHIGLGTTREISIKQAASLIAHQACSLNVDMGPRDRKLHPLVLTDRTSKHNTIFNVSGHTIHKPVTVTDTFGGNQRAFCVQAIKNIFKSFAFLANQVLCRNLEIVKKQFICLVVHHVQDRTNGQTLANCVTQINDKN